MSTTFLLNLSIVLQAYISICDLLIVFGRHLATSNALLEPLVNEPEKNLQGLLANFLTEKVFIDDEDGNTSRRHVTSLLKN